MSQALRKVERYPWLDRLMDDPDRAVDTVLRGVAYLPGLQRASPCEALLAIMGDLPADAPEVPVLDRALCRWLQVRRNADEAVLDRPGGLRVFIAETGEGFRAAWRLELPETSAWIRANLYDLLRWADGLSLDATFDLGTAVLTAAAHLQTNTWLRHLWFDVCERAAERRLRHRLTVGLNGLVRMPVEGAIQPSHDVIVGLARWAARLNPEVQGAKGEVAQEWRSLKATFPRLPTFWRKEWEAILDESTYNHPFLEWLKEADSALHQPTKSTTTRRTPLIPKNIPDLIREFGKTVDRRGLTTATWSPVKSLLDQIEHYADVTGESYFLVTSCTNIASIVLPHAPGHALSLTRRALVWAPSNGHAWSIRARALSVLNRDDLATAVLREGMRRAPSNPAFHVQLALGLADQGRGGEAEELLTKAIAIDPTNAHAHAELARLRWLHGRAQDAIDLLRAFGARATDSGPLYTLACLLIAEGRREEAAEAAGDYRQHIGEDHRLATLRRLLSAADHGQEEVRQHLMAPRRREEQDAIAAVPWDEGVRTAALAEEEAEQARLLRIGLVSEADSILRSGIEAQRGDALEMLENRIAEDGFDAYPQLVKVLAVPDYRHELEGRAARFAGSLPLQTALMPQDAPERRWDDLASRFPDGRPLISLARLNRGDTSSAVVDPLEKWTETPNRWDETWPKFLKEQVAMHLNGRSGSPLPLATLTHDALIQAVDVGWDAAPQNALTVLPVKGSVANQEGPGPTPSAV